MLLMSMLVAACDGGESNEPAAADELVASLEGFDIQHCFGDTLGYETAERLVSVPGRISAVCSWLPTVTGCTG